MKSLPTTIEIWEKFEAVMKTCSDEPGLALLHIALDKFDHATLVDALTYIPVKYMPIRQQIIEGITQYSLIALKLDRELRERGR